MPEFSDEKFAEIKAKLEQVFTADMEVEDFTGDTAPSTADLPDKNKGLVLYNCSILFVDIRSSTQLSDKTQVRNMAKIYRAFARAMSMCIYSSGGAVRQIAGDRVMGVFVDDAEESSATKALTAARAIVTVVEHIFNPLCQVNINNKTIECGIGIDNGRVLAASIGIKHQEEDSRDLVWAGKIANIASKHTDLANGKEIFITKRFYNKLPATAKKKDDGTNVWTNCYRFKGETIFEGFCVSDYYLNLDSQTPLTVEPSSSGVQKGLEEGKIISTILEGVKTKTQELLDKFESVIARENNVLLKENELTSKETMISERIKSLNLKEQALISKEREIKLATELSSIKATYQVKMEFLRDNLNSYTLKSCLTMMEELFELGEKLGKTPADCKNDIYYWKLVKYFKEKDELLFAYKCIIEQLTCPISYLILPEHSLIVEIVKNLGKEQEYLESVLYCISNYKPKLDIIIELRQILIKLGIRTSLSGENQLTLQ